MKAFLQAILAFLKRTQPVNEPMPEGSFKMVTDSLEAGDNIEINDDGSVVSISAKINYFQPSETKCKCGKCDGDILPKMRDFLNRIRADYGKPLVIVSGYRCPVYNATEDVGGARHSQHPKKRAADIRINSHEMQQEIFDLAVKHGATGIGIYNTFIHVDIRKLTDIKRLPADRWDNRDNKKKKIKKFWDREHVPHKENE